MKPIAAVMLTALVLMTTPVALVAQIPDNQKAPPRPAQATVPVFQENPDARQTRQRFIELLRQIPPSVGEILQRDPSLLLRADYLAPYPVLVAFLQQHPEIARNPGFFLGEFRYYEPHERDRAYETLQMLLAALGVGAGLSAVIGVFVWVVRTAIDHRRWLRLSRVQTEVHMKLLDRLTTNEELLAYIQSPAGRRFLESAPITVEQEPRTMNAPVSRILWSMQAGMVLWVLGLGFWLVQTRLSADIGEGFWVIGVLVAALGIGFVASAILAYTISKRLGLVQQRKVEQQT